jgi:TIR domain
VAFNFFEYLMITLMFFFYMPNDSRKFMPSKPLLFISHITEEKELAITFKELVESQFLGMLDVFVSSDENSIGMGQRWLDSITDALTTCAVEVILCSPQSIRRPWINFEAGAGWIRQIPVIPLCHSGIKPSELPMPLNLLQAAELGEISSLKLVFPVLANALGAKPPMVDFTEFTKTVREFEVKYTFWDACNHAFTQIHQFHEMAITLLKQGQSVALGLTETQFNYLGNVVSFLANQNVLALGKKGGMSMTGTDTIYNCELSPLPKLKSVLSDVHFKYAD